MQRVKSVDIINQQGFHSFTIFSQTTTTENLFRTIDYIIRVHTEFNLSLLAKHPLLNYGSKEPRAAKLEYLYARQNVTKIALFVLLKQRGAKAESNHRPV